MPSILDTDTPCRHKEAMQAQPGFPNRRFLQAEAGRGRGAQLEPRRGDYTSFAFIVAPNKPSPGIPRSYQNRLTPIKHPQPLSPIIRNGSNRSRDQSLGVPAVVNDSDADSTFAPGVGVTMLAHYRNANHLAPVRPSSSWSIPGASTMGRVGHTRAAGVSDFCTPAKNHLAARHTREVIDPFLKSLRGKVPSCSTVCRGLVIHSPQALRSFTHNPTPEERKQGVLELEAKLRGFKYRGEPLPATLSLSDDKPVVDYFKQFPGLDAGPRFNNAGFWDLPIPVTRDIQVYPDDVVVYDAEGYEKLREFLRGNGVPSRAAHGVCHRHVLRQDVRRLRESLSRLQCVPRRGCHTCHLSCARDAQSGHQCPHCVCLAQPTRYPRFPGFNMTCQRNNRYSATNRREFIRTISWAGAVAGLGSRSILAEQSASPSSVETKP